MRKLKLYAAGLGLLLVSGTLNAQDTPIGDKWWPSEWGAEDQRGAILRVTTQKVIQAAQLVKEGKIYQLGRVYESGMPLFGDRHYSLTIISSPSGGPLGENSIVWHDEMFSGEIGQVGTQFDGLGHIGTRVGNEDVFYNGFKRSEFSKAYGLEKLGVENVGAFFTRGVLVDVAGYKGIDRLEVGYVITVADVEGTLEKQGVDITEGDVVLFRTGHGKLWMVDNETYNSGEPGIGMEVAAWLIDRKIAMTAGDSWAVEAVPGDDPDRPFAVHQELLNKHGIYNLENLDLEALAADQVYEFAFVFSPLKLKGATGSPGNPIAVK